ncbi:MAG: 4-hydroxythreonine-4-phosphate dehydrogenase PdxA [Thermoanaerobaculia bacterium]|nr:4-hydroxythreonine-4-phosphate dehydrogenase PdxA [Thermoanaerobaculia bacterium]
MTPTLVFTQGDPAGIGPEILARLLLAGDPPSYRAVVVAELAALEAHACGAGLELPPLPTTSVAAAGAAEGRVLLLDPVAESRRVSPGRPGRADAIGAMAALDTGIELMRRGVGDALVTAPVAKALIAEHVDPHFVGHTDYLAHAAGLESYGREYLMCFLAEDLKVALLSAHLPLVDAISQVTPERVADALGCLHRVAGAGRIAVAGLNPHAGEGGLLGREDDERVRPGVEAARRAGVDVSGPQSADSLFARARRGEFDWVLALYHDQGLIAVKTVAFGTATNWTLGLPWIRTSVDHGTAYDVAGRGAADIEPLSRVVATTLDLVEGRR